MGTRKFLILTLILLLSERGLFSQIESNSRGGIFSREESAQFHQPSKQNSGDSLNVRLIGRWANGQCLAVDVVGNRTYLGNGSYLEIVDFTRPDNPSLMSKIMLPATILGVKADDKYAYVAADRAGLFIVSISDPYNPAKTAHLETTGNASGLDISGTTLYLSDGNAGLKIIDIANPRDPREIKLIETKGSALKVVVDEFFAYVADGSGGLLVIDISIPEQAREVTSYPTTGNVMDVAVLGNHVFIAVQEAGLVMLDFSDRKSLTEIDLFHRYKSISAIALGDYHAYITDSQFGLAILDFSNFDYLKEAGSLPMEGKPTDIALSSTYAYVADRHLGLKMIDVSKPFQPQQRAFFSSGGISRGVSVQGHYAYLAQWEAGIRVIDIATPSQPVLIGSLDLNGRAEEAKVKDDFAYITNYENGLRIIRVTDPTYPIEAGIFNQNMNARSVAIEGSLAFIADSSFGLRIVDVTNPLQPSLIGSCQIQNIQAEDICKAADYVFLAGGNEGLRIINAANPVQPVAVGVFDADNTAISIAVDENYAYLGYLQNKLSIVDISDPTNPSEVGHLDLVNPPYELVVKGRYVYIADGNSGLRVIDAMVPSNPVEVGYYVTGSPAFDVTIDNKFIYLVDQNTGLYILDFEMASGNVAPEPPLLIAPEHNSFVNTVMPNFSWQSPRDNNDDLLHFQIELDEDGDWTNVDFKIDSRFDPIGFSPTPPVPQASGVISYASQFEMNEGKWRWRVSAWDGLAASDFSSTWTFTIDTTAPFIQQFFFENPGYGEAWFNPSQDTIAKATVSYSELFPERGKLSSILLPDTMQISNLTGGFDQEIQLQFSIANQSDGEYSVFLSIQDSAGNIGNTTKNIRLDSTPPQGYYSDAPDTISAGEAYVVHILEANDGQGSGVAEIFLDVFTNFQGEPAAAQDSLIGITEPGIYFYRYFVVDNLGNRGILKTDTTVVVPVISRAPIYPVPEITEVKAGTEFWIAIVVGSEQEPVQNLSRTSYILNYSNTLYVDTILDSVLPGSFLGEDVDFNYQIEDDRGEVTITIGQKAGGDGASGNGTISRLKFKSNANAPDQSIVLFTLSSISARNALDYPIELIPGDTTITIIQPLYDFTMVVEPDSQAIYPGESTNFIARFEPVGDFNSEIAIEISNLPDGMQAIYSDQPFEISDSVKIEFTTSDQITPGVYHPIIVATGGGISHQQRITINVLEPVSFADFSMTVQPDSRTIYQGENTKFNLSFQPFEGFDSPIELTITNLPPGMNVDFPTDPFTIPASIKIEFTTESDIEPGVYYPLIIATGGGITHHVNVKITVLQRVDFIMIIRPDSQSVVAGESIEFEISFIPVGGFNSKITVELSNVPEGVEAIFTSRPFDIPISFDIKFRVPKTIPPKYYFPIVTATGGGITHQQTIIIHVLPRNSSTQIFGVQPNPFTPNNDGFNDYAIFNFPETLNGTATILIFDINGRKITEIRNSANWYGKDDKGREVKPGAYIYLIKNGDKVISKGVVSLAR